MRVAVCMFGLLRNFELTFPRFKKFVLDPTGADVFFCGHPNKDGYDSCHAKLASLYAPKRYILKEVTPEYLDEIRGERARLFSTHKRSETILDNFLSHMRNLEEVDRLRCSHEKETGVKYDAVMFVRPDVFFVTPVPEKLILQVSGDPSLIVMPSGPGGSWDIKFVNPVCMSDRFVLAHPDTASRFASINSKCEDYFRQGIIAHPETMFGYHVSSEKLARIDCDPVPFTFNNPDDKTTPHRFKF